MTLPRSSIPSVAKYMSGLKVQDRAEKQLMVRIGTLIDAIVAAQRGSNNAGSNLDRKALQTNLSTPPRVTGSTQNIFNGISVNLDPVTDPSNLSHYEVQIDTDNTFSDPTTKIAFNTDMTFKGLTSETDYFVRARALSKNGIVSDWLDLDSIRTGATPGINTSSIDGTLDGEQGVSEVFHFNSDAEDVFVVSNFGLRQQEGDFYLSVTMDGAIQEKLILEGPELSTAPITYADETMTLIRYWPMAFFTLIEPADAPSDHFFSVIDPQDELTTSAVVWVKF